MSPPQNYTLVTNYNIADTLLKDIQKSRRRIAIVSTTLHNDGPEARLILEALSDAAERGVAVSIAADTLSYTEPKEIFIRSPKRQPMRAYRAMRTERMLKNSGAEFRWLGRHSNIGIAGRTHAKWMIIDDIVYSFGGINIDSGSFENTDFLLRVEDSAIADTMIQVHTRMLEADRGGHASRSKAIVLNDHDTLLVDGGLSFDSIIYRRATALAKQASHITFVSQYCPTGKLARILRKKNAPLYYNHWRAAHSLNKGMIRFGMFVSRNSTYYDRDNYLHAKFILFTMPNGKKHAITGSHNYMASSVILGTREVGLETTDPSTIRLLEDFFDTYVKAT